MLPDIEGEEGMYLFLSVWIRDSVVLVLKEELIAGTTVRIMIDFVLMGQQIITFSLVGPYSLACFLGDVPR